MSDLVVSVPTDPGLLEALAAEFPSGSGVAFVTWDLDGPALASQIDIVIPPYWGGRKRVARVAEVHPRLVQWQSIGYDGVEKSLPDGIPLANAATVHETSTAELALALALAAQREIPRFVRDAAEHRWRLFDAPSLADRRVLIIGYGGVGKAVDRRLQGFEARITRIATTARREAGPGGADVEVRSIENLHAELANAEIVILTVPLNPATEHLIDAAALAAMPDGALLVNVARGRVVDTDALVAELRQGRLRAAVDVTDPEPLPEDHPLWEAPGALITPHVGGASSAMLPRMVALIARQIRHLQADETPENVVLGG